jgi:hypothetical protein
VRVVCPIACRCRFEGNFDDNRDDSYYPNDGGYIPECRLKRLVTSPARSWHWGLGLSLHPLCIRHAVRIACSEPSELVQFVQFDQHKRLTPDFASA